MTALGFIVIVLVMLHLAAAMVATGLITRRIEQAYPPDGMFVDVQGGRLHLYDRPAQDTPAGPPILLLHGATANARDMLLALADPLAKRHRVIAIDRPGHGWSDRPDGDADASPARQATLILEALDKIGAAKVVVVGYSWSGALAAHLALDHKEHVSGLVLISGVTHAWPGGISWYYGLAAKPGLGRLFVHTMMTPLGSYSFGAGIESAFAPQAPVAGYADATAAALVLRPDEFRYNAQDVAALLQFVERQSARYGEIAVPTAVITGDADTTVSPDIHSRIIAGQIKGARLTILPGIGHMPHHVAKAAVVAEIERVVREAK